jgi:hypothetical protein
MLTAGISSDRELITARPVPIFSNRYGQWDYQGRIVCELQNESSVSAGKKLEHPIAIRGGDIETALSDE